MVTKKPADRDDPKIASTDKNGVVRINANEATKAQDEAGTRQHYQALGSDLGAVQAQFTRDVISSLWLPEGMSPDDIEAKINGALLIFSRLAPRDEAEAMLAVQMVAAHNAAMECYRRSMIAGQTFESRDMSLKHAGKMSALYDKLMAAYDRRRGKRDQTVVVKHMTVKDGGQAIVGDVHTHAAPGQTGRRTLEHGSPGALEGALIPDEAQRKSPAPVRQTRSHDT